MMQLHVATIRRNLRLRLVCVVAGPQRHIGNGFDERSQADRK
jgi:hypothetical protein